MNPPNRVSETIHSGHFMASNVHELKTEDDEEIDVVSESGMEPPDPEVRPDTKDDKPVTFYKFGPITTRSIAIDISLSKLNKCIQIAYDKGKLTTPKWKNFKGLKLDWKDRIRLNNVIWRAWHMQFVLNNKPKYCFFSIPNADYWHSRSEASIVEGMYWKRKLETVCAQYTRWRHFYFKHGDKRRRSVVREYSDSVKENRSRMNTFFDDELLFSSSGNFTPPLSTFDNDDDFTNWFTDTLFSSLNQPYMFPNPKQFAQSDNADLVQPGLIQLQPSLEEIMASLVQSESNSSYMQEGDSLLNVPPDRNVALAGADSVQASSSSNSRSVVQMTGSVVSNKDYQSAQSYDYGSQMNNYTFIGSPGGGHSSSSYRFDYEPPMAPVAQMQYNMSQNDRFNVNQLDTAEGSLTEMTPLIIPLNDDVSAGSSRQIFGAYGYHESPSNKCTKKRSLQAPQTSFNHRFNSQPNMWPQSANDSNIINNDVSIVSGGDQSASFQVQQSPPSTPLLLNLPTRKKRVAFEQSAGAVTETATPPKNAGARRKRASFDTRMAALTAQTSPSFDVNVDKALVPKEAHPSFYKARSESSNQTRSAPFTAELLTNRSNSRAATSTASSAVLSAPHRSTNDVKQELKNLTLRKTSIAAAAKEATAEKLGVEKARSQQSFNQTPSSNEGTINNGVIQKRLDAEKLNDNSESRSAKRVFNRKNRYMGQLSTTSDINYVVETSAAVNSNPSAMLCPSNDSGLTDLHHQQHPPDCRRIKSVATCPKQVAVKTVQPNQIRASPYSVPTVTSNYAAIYNHLDMDQIATSAACNFGPAIAPVESKVAAPPSYKTYSPTSTSLRGASHCGHSSGAVLRPIPMNLSRSTDKQSAFSCLSPSNQLLSPPVTAPSIPYNANKCDIEPANALAVPLNLSHSPLAGASMLSSPLNPLSAFIAGATPSPVNSATATTPSCLSSDYFRSCLGTPVPPTSYVYTLPTNTTSYFSGMSPDSPSPSVLLLHSLGNVQFPIVSLPYPTSSFPTSTKEETTDKIAEPGTRTEVLVATLKNQAQPTTTVDKNLEELMSVSSNIAGKCSNYVGTFNSEEKMKNESSIKSESPGLTSALVDRLKQTYSGGKGSKGKNAKRAAADSTEDATERKRLLHLNAEQSRRFALKGGFEKLEELLPNLKSNATKITNAVVLLRAGERTRELKKETNESANLIENLKNQIKELNEKINNYQKVLPSQSTKCKSEVLRQRINGRVKQSVEADPKFWLLFKVIEPLVESFKSEVKGASLSEVINTARDWSSRHCNHAELRPIVSQLLVSLATDSPILSSPASFATYISQQIHKL